MLKTELTPEIQEKVKEIYIQEQSIRKTREKVNKILEISLTFHNVRDIVQGLYSDITEREETLQDLNDEISGKKLYEILEHEDGQYYLLVHKGLNRTFKIKVDLVDQIFKDYSKHGNNLSGEEILSKYNIKPEVFTLLKSKLRLYKASDVISPFTAENISEDELQEKIDEAIDENLSRTKDKMIITYEKKFKQNAKKAMEIVGNFEYKLEMLRKVLDNYKPKPFDFIPETPKNRDEITVLFSDVHIGKKDTHLIKERIFKMTNDILNRRESVVNIIGLGDYVETFVEGGMHPGQIENMVGPFGFDLMMEVVSLFENMLITLYKYGKVVKMAGISGNHCFIKQDNPEFLTEYGYKTFDEIVENNLKVGQLNNGQLEFTYPTGIINEYRYGEFITYGNNKSKKFTVTDGHKFIINSEKIEAKDINSISIVDTPRINGVYSFSKVDELALLTIFDGCVVYNKDHFKRLQFKISKPNKIEYIENFLKANNIHYTKTKATMSGGNVLQPYLIKITGQIARDVKDLIGRYKQVPKIWYNADNKSKKIILNIIANTDGTLRGDSLRMYNTDDSILSLCETLFITNKYKYTSGGFGRKKPCYELSFTKNIQLRKIKQEYKGYDIVDFEMPNGNLFVRVGGTCFNHSNCRLTKDNNGDLEKTGGIIMLEMVKRGLSNLDIQVEYFREEWNSLNLQDFNFIINHGTKNNTSINPKQILWEHGKQDKHNIIAFGDKHHGHLTDVSDNATKIIVPALAGAGDYDKRLVLSSYSGYVIIEKNDDGLPNTIFRRLK